MNILIPHTWLLEHLETKASPKEIQKYLSLSGPSVERIYQIEGEDVYDIEITTNRADSMNIHGVAREAAVILNQAGIKAKLKPLKITLNKSLQVKEKLPAPKVFNNPKINKRIVFIILKDIKRNPTPDWMAKRLTQTDLNVHDAAIDITNYVTHEIGHPIHAFDYDKLMQSGGEIHIVEAKAGKKFTTLDGETYQTVGGEIVFENDKGEIIDLPSVKGTANTSVDKNTHNILLLAESIQADKVRFTSMTHAIRTVAAQLIEKHIDPNLAEDSLLRAADLYQDLCEAKLGSRLIDEFSQRPDPQPIKVKLQQIDAYLGLEIKLEKIVKILQDLECQVKTRGEGRKIILSVQPPTFRPDLTIPADVIEEVARIYGYHNLPSTLMETPIPTSYPKDTNFNLENRIKRFLSDIGWQEVYTYSLVSEAIALESGRRLEDHLKLQNPLTEDRIYLRRSLLPSLTEIITNNPQQKELSVFEIANTYQPQKDNLPKEELCLAAVSTQNYRHLRGILEVLLAQLYIADHQIVEDEKKSHGFAQSATIMVKKQPLGTIGLLKSGLTGMEIPFKNILAVAKSHPSYQPIPKTMPLFEDLTFTLPSNTAVGNLMADIKAVDKLITKVELKDIYKKNHTFTIEYHDLKKNLSVGDIELIRKKIVQMVEKQHQAQLIGEV